MAGQAECTGTRTACRDCGGPLYRPRRNRVGLCRGCYRRPEVRGRYFSDRAKFAPKAGDDYRRGTPPAEPTGAPPGTAAKLEVLALRRLRGEQLTHPADARAHAEHLC